jgi:acetate kinase
MSDVVLCINSGSATVKFSVYQAPGGQTVGPLVCHGLVEQRDGAVHLWVRDSAGRTIEERNVSTPQAAGRGQLLNPALAWLGEHSDGMRVIAAGHRVVHGGERFIEPVRLTGEIIDALEALIPLAPLHQPHNLAGIRALAATRPDLPQVACFDTAFHSSQPPAAQRFALPRAMTASGIHRYGFHGLSYAYIARVLPDHLGERADGRVVVAHLGNGASLCALRERKSVATTMGFTALDGLMMGTRCGNLDPGVLLYLLSQRKMDADALTDLLYHRSGLLGVSGISSDMRTLLASDDPHAKEAVELFCYRITREIGSLAAALGGLDALVFTAGIGEHADEIRLRVCEASRWLGVSIDKDKNLSGSGCISTDASAVAVWIVPTDEESVVARETLKHAGLSDALGR